MLRKAEAPVLVLAALLLSPSTARADQLFGVTLGYFSLIGDDARSERDVLLVNRQNELPLAFELDDFNGATIGVEWLVGLGDFVEAGVGVGYYRKTVPSVYERFVDSDGTEIEQDLRLRIVPMAATLRVLPLGRGGPVQPYVGGGFGLFNWRYSEIGEFVDSADLTIFTARFVDRGTDAGVVAVGGLRAPVGDTATVGGEVRYQRARGSLSEDFLSDTIDLGGYTVQFAVHWRF